MYSMSHSFGLTFNAKNVAAICVVENCHHLCFLKDELEFIKFAFCVLKHCYGFISLIVSQY